MAVYSRLIGPGDESTLVVLMTLLRRYLIPPAAPHIRYGKVARDVNPVPSIAAAAPGWIARLVTQMLAERRRFRVFRLLRIPGGSRCPSA